jgi:hypothetical protein
MVDKHAGFLKGLNIPARLHVQVGNNLSPVGKCSDSITCRYCLHLCRILEMLIREVLKDLSQKTEIAIWQLIAYSVQTAKVTCGEL